MWRCYRSREEVKQLEASLDDRGINEGLLKRALQADMAILLTEMSAEPPPPPIGDEWLRHGPHVGRRVRLHFDDVGESEGTVVALREDREVWW